MSCLILISVFLFSPSAVCAPPFDSFIAVAIFLDVHRPRRSVLPRAMPKSGGPNHRGRFPVVIYRLSGETIVIPRCTPNTTILEIFKAIAAASEHLYIELEDSTGHCDWDGGDVQLVYDSHVIGVVSHKLAPRLQVLTLKELDIDKDSLLFVVLNDAPPELGSSTSDESERQRPDTDSSDSDW